MFEQQHHEMVLATVHESGAEEWYCPTCGRRFLMQWPPEYKKVILWPGDEFAIHSGGKGGGVQPPAPEPEPEDPYLTPFINWMKRSGYEGLWSAS